MILLYFRFFNLPDIYLTILFYSFFHVSYILLQHKASLLHIKIQCQSKFITDLYTFFKVLDVIVCKLVNIMVNFYSILSNTLFSKVSIITFLIIDHINYRILSTNLTYFEYKLSKLRILGKGNIKINKHPTNRIIPIQLYNWNWHLGVVN